MAVGEPQTLMSGEGSPNEVSMLLTKQTAVPLTTPLLRLLTTRQDFDLHSVLGLAPTFFLFLPVFFFFLENLFDDFFFPFFSKDFSTRHKIMTCRETI